MDLISTEGDIICIGRSGTGKTTSAVLRIFATEILYWVWQKMMREKGMSLKELSFEAGDIEKTSGLHIIFVTASSILTIEVKRFYDKLKDWVMKWLRRKELKKQGKLEEL